MPTNQSQAQSTPTEVTLPEKPLQAGFVFAVLGSLLAALIFVVLGSVITEIYQRSQEVALSGSGDPKLIAGSISRAIVKSMSFGLASSLGIVVIVATIILTTYRKKWFFLTSVILASVHLLYLPVGTVVGILLLALLFIKRREFQSKPAHLTIDGIGKFNYVNYDEDEHWELVSEIKDNQNSIHLDFFAIAGDHTGPFDSSEVVARDLLQNPDKLWNLVDDRFIELAREDISGVTKETIREQFYIRTLAVVDQNSLEVGFHAVAADILLEMIVKDGSVSMIEKDYGCCEI